MFNKIMFLLVIILLLNSCVLEYGFNFKEQFNTEEEIFNWIYINIKKKKDSPSNDYWQTPEQTYKRRTGDCEDKAILFMEFAKQSGFKSKLYLTEDHAYIKSSGKFYDIPFNSITDKNPYNDTIYKFDYDEVMWFTYNFHGMKIL